MWTCGHDNGPLLNPTIECEIVRDTDAGHSRFAKYVASKEISHLNDAVEYFQLVLDQCPVAHKADDYEDESALECTLSFLITM